MRTLRILTVLFLGCLFFGCSESSVVIDGQFFGESGRDVYLEKLSPMGGTIVDSTKTDEKGKFSFHIKDKLGVPTFFNVNMGNSYVPLLVEDGEDVEISSMANIFYNYTVEGSKGSELIKQFNMLVRNTTLKMDSLVALYEGSVDYDRSQQLGREYERAYIDFKRDAIVFITKNCNSLASLLPLYKPYNTDGQFLFDQPSDYLYFVMLSDSLSNRYPTSDYVISLKKDLDMLETKQMNFDKVDSMINASYSNIANYPDISMTDAAGKQQKLSANAGKIILLSFTASEPAELKIVNAELKDIYEKYNEKGLAVYQVFLDTNKALWLNTVSAQRLPWVTVCDFAGAQGVAAKTYNITKVPTNILIDRDGNIISTDVGINELDEKLSKLF